MTDKKIDGAAEKTQQLRAPTPVRDPASASRLATSTPAPDALSRHPQAKHAHPVV